MEGCKDGRMEGWKDASKPEKDGDSRRKAKKVRKPEIVGER